MTIDTNILIAYLGGEEAVIEKILSWRRSNRPLFISIITECELLSYPKLSPTEEAKIESFLKENFISIPFDGSYVRKVASLRRRIANLKLPDAIIAAVALETRTPLVTRNTRDFQNVPSLTIVTI